MTEHANQMVPQNPTLQVPPKKEKSWTWVWLMVIAIVLTANGVVTMLGGIPVKAESQKWEYAGEFATDSQLATKFTEAGEKHWEIVHCRRAKSSTDWGYECIFKRPKK